MPLEYEAIRKSFSSIAHQYEHNAILQKEVLSRLLERLDDEQKLDADFKSKQILDLGCGTGWALKYLFQLFPQAEISALDFSAAMLNEYSQTTEQVETIHADVHDLPFADASHDVVFSNMLLHWCNEEDVFSECLRVLKPGGLLIMSALGETSLYELKQAWQQVDDSVHVHDFPALHKLGDQLLVQGFSDVVVNTEIITLTYNDLLTLMRDIKASGGHNVMEHRHKGLMSTLKLQRLIKAYEVFREDDRLPASYEIVYLRAKKPLEKERIKMTISTIE
jgi:malonyl-CoA O-methyltransferase